MGEDGAELSPLLPCCPLEVAVTWVTRARAVTSLQWVWVPPGAFLCLPFPRLPPDKHLNSEFPGKELGQEEEEGYGAHVLATVTYSLA